MTNDEADVRAYMLADAYATMDVETEGVKGTAPHEWIITPDALCDEMTAASVEHLRYRGLADIFDGHNGLVVQFKEDE